MNKAERNSPSSSSPSGSKLPKFFHKQSRDRSRSMVDPSGSSSTIASSSSTGSHPDTTIPGHHTRPPARKSSKKLFGSRDKEEKHRHPLDITDDTNHDHIPPNHHVPLHDTSHIHEANNHQDPQDETPVIVEPVAIPRPRPRSDRPLSDNYPSVAFFPSSPSSNNRISDLSSRLSGWFNHAFNTSSTDLSLPSLLSQQHVASSSPKGKSSALLTAAKHGRGHLDKAMRYLLDSDATPDKCTDPIWLLGVEHLGYEPSSPTISHTPNIGRRGSTDSRRSPSSLHSSPSSSPIQSHADPALSQSQPPSAASRDPGRNWSPVFYSDFTSCVWLTYRSQFNPIRDTTLEDLNSEAGDNVVLASSPQPKKWNWPLGGEKQWSSDTGWGCMLRTGQSLLANALIHLHLGRDWRKPPHPVYTADYATYVQILTWFLDDPSSLCPFSVHRMALVGKQLGVKVGQWFGPSTAAGAIKTLVHAFPTAGLGVYVAADGGTIYESEVLAASHTAFGSPRRSSRRTWGDRAVIVLIGHRLGIDRVNPVYYDTLKDLYTWPQTIGIAGGRPSSSYYFVGSQADNLFYLDPHHTRPAIPLRPPPRMDDPPPPLSRHTSPEPSYTSDRERERDRHPRTPARHARNPTSPTSGRSSVASGSSFSHRAPVAPSPLQQQISTSSTSSNTHSSSSQSHPRWYSSSALPDESEMDSREFEGQGSLADLDNIQRHYATAYSANELKTFHCDRVRKMPLSGLDPSMLMGFLCKDEHDWNDFKNRINMLNMRYKATVLTVQDEPPHWTSDSEMGMESISEPDIDMPEDDEDELERFSERSPSASPDTSVSAQDGAAASTGSKSEADTEEDPIDPITPGAGKSSFDIIEAPQQQKKEELSVNIKGSNVDDSLGFDDEDDDDEEWVDPSEFTPQTPSPGWQIPSLPTPEPQTQPQQPFLHAPKMRESRSSGSAISRQSSSGSNGNGRPRERRKPKKSTSSSGHTVTRSGSQSQDQQPQYPFPATNPGDDEEVQIVGRSTGKGLPQMRTAKARDGGRTQSGGVRGVPTDDGDDF